VIWRDQDIRSAGPSWVKARHFARLRVKHTQAFSLSRQRSVAGGSLDTFRHQTLRNQAAFIALPCKQLLIGPNAWRSNHCPCYQTTPYTNAAYRLSCDSVAFNAWQSISLLVDGYGVAFERAIDTSLHTAQLTKCTINVHTHLPIKTSAGVMWPNNRLCVIRSELSFPVYYVKINFQLFTLAYPLWHVC